MPTIYDNIEEILAHDLSETLSESFRSDFCVGYFNLRGWKNVVEHIEKFDGEGENCCRLIVGMQRPSEDLLKQVLANQKPGIVDQAKVVALKKAMAYDFREQLTFGIPSAQDEESLQQLSSQLKSKKVRVKLYLSHPLHAKLYLGFRNDKKSPTIEIDKNKSRIIYGKAEVDQYKITTCKPQIDEIDTILAQHYGFTEEELDFIINYDIKYRMGKALFGEEDNGEEVEG